MGTSYSINHSGMRAQMGEKAHKIFTSVFISRIGYRVPKRHELPGRMRPDAITPEGYPVELKPTVISGSSVARECRRLDEEWQMAKYLQAMDAPEGEIWEWTYNKTSKSYDFYFRDSYTIAKIIQRRQEVLRSVIIAKIHLKGIDEIEIRIPAHLKQSTQ